MKPKDIFYLLLVPAVLMAFIGVVLLSIGGWYLAVKSKERATVVGYSSQVVDDEHYYAIVVETAKGEILKSDSYKEGKNYAVGGQIEIFLLNDDDFVIDPVKTYLYSGATFLFLGAVPIILIFVCRRRCCTPN